MAPSKAQRLQLYEELVKKFGDEPAMTLMESLPPVDWHELATKDDLAGLEERVNAKFEVVDARFDALRVELGARIDTGVTGLGAKIDTGLTGLGARIDTGLTGLGARIGTGVTGLGAKIDTGLADLRGETKLDMARLTRDMVRQTYVILAGLAAIITPIYIALFTGAG